MEPVDDDDDLIDWAEEYGVLIGAAFGLDKSWAPRGRCRQWDYEDGDATFRPSPWHVASSSVVEVAGEPVSGRELVKVALIICAGCPVQWDCARYAVRGMMQAGTWAMRITFLRDLQKDQPAALALLDAAEASGVSVQVAVDAHRASVDKALLPA